MLWATSASYPSYPGVYIFTFFLCAKFQFGLVMVVIVSNNDGGTQWCEAQLWGTSVSYSWYPSIDNFTFFFMLKLDFGHCCCCCCWHHWWWQHLMRWGASAAYSSYPGVDNFTIFSNSKFQFCTVGVVIVNDNGSRSLLLWGMALAHACHGVMCRHRVQQSHLRGHTSAHS